MMIDFPFILIFLTIASGLIYLVDKLYLSKHRAISTESQKNKLPLLIDYSKSLFPVFIFVLLLRSFLGQLYVVPSGSLAPTVKPGDYLIVSQYPYGIHLPLWHTTLIATGKPKRGEIALFHWPVNPKVDYIKRVVGVPGDRLSYINKILYINGKAAEQKFVKKTMFGDSPMLKWPVKQMQEALNGVKHGIYICDDSAVLCPGHSTQNFYNLIIPKGKYLMMGDNRDDSDDGRYWGFVLQKAFVGRGEFVVFSWDSAASWWPFNKIRWHRIGKRL